MREKFSPTLRLIVVAGTASNTGKTTLLCDLLRTLTPYEPWEAIKLTRGHYRSCGKDPHACCVSPLLGAEPLVRSGRAETYVAGKDTGRYWEAGASNVHWVIATNEQVEAGVRQALARVQTGRVLIEGTSLLRFIQPDFALLMGELEPSKIKASARQALREGWIDALYLPMQGTEYALSVFTPQTFTVLVERIRAAAQTA
jgi:molybdopterin-guanine dinucleotide biosynthesis protein